jgi:hypothetical protein
VYACRIAWFITFSMSLFKPRRERTMGSMRDLLFICLLFVSLKLDGVAAYTWSVVFLIPWMWFGALFLGAIVVSVRAVLLPQLRTAPNCTVSAACVLKSNSRQVLVQQVLQPASTGGR